MIPCTSSGVALLGVSDGPDGRTVVLHFAPGCVPAGTAFSGALGMGVTRAPAADDSLGTVRLSPAIEAALAAKHASAAAQGAVQTAKPSRRETIVALATAVAVLLLK